MPHGRQEKKMHKTTEKRKETKEEKNTKKERKTGEKSKIPLSACMTPVPSTTNWLTLAAG